MILNPIRDPTVFVGCSNILDGVGFVGNYSDVAFGVSEFGDYFVETGRMSVNGSSAGL